MGELIFSENINLPERTERLLIKEKLNLENNIYTFLLENIGFMNTFIILFSIFIYMNLDIKFKEKRISH